MWCHVANAKPTVHDFTLYYNVYSLPRFKKFIYDLGAKDVHVYDFEINMDIPRSNVDYMVTYTMIVDNNKRLQISGAVVMFWKIIKIELWLR